MSTIFIQIYLYIVGLNQKLTMKKLIFLLAIAFTFSNSMAQTAWTTMYKVAPENMQAAKDAIGKKTKKFNSKADGRFFVEKFIQSFNYRIIHFSICLMN